MRFHWLARVFLNRNSPDVRIRKRGEKDILDTEQEYSLSCAAFPGRHFDRCAVVLRYPAHLFHHLFSQNLLP